MSSIRTYPGFFLLATLVQFGPGLRFYRKGVPALLRLAPDMDSLVVLGSTAAWGYSVVATFAPGLLPDGTRNVYFEASAVIVTLILLGRWLEAKAKGRTSEAISHLMGLQAKSARVERDGAFVDVPPEEVRAGDVIQVRPGDRLPVDGVENNGASYVDEAMISGEPVPVEKRAGDAITGGTINQTGSFTYRAQKVGSDTVLAQIIRMVESAQGAKLPIQALVDRVTAWFVPAVMLAAAATFGLWFFFGPEPAVTFAIVNAARDEGLFLPEAADFDAIPGFGIRAAVNGRWVEVGADRFMDEIEVDISDFGAQAEALASRARTPLYVSIDRTLAALIAVADPIKATAPVAIRSLRAMGLRVAMVTGDNARTADAVARELGIDEVVAEVLPHGKVTDIRALRAGGRKVAFVGDRINDAPARAEADVGIAIGTGTDIAIETADVVLMAGELTGVSKAIGISRATIRNIRQNLFWAFAYNAALVPVAAGVLWPVSGTLLSPMLAAGAMALSSVFVLGNALRLKRFQPAGANRQAREGGRMPDDEGALPRPLPLQPGTLR